MAVGYDYRGDTLCPSCTVQALIDRHLLPEEAKEVAEAVALNEAALRSGIDRDDERSYDSGKFPKTIDTLSIEDHEHCYTCYKEIG